MYPIIWLYDLSVQCFYEDIYIYNVLKYAIKYISRLLSFFSMYGI